MLVGGARVGRLVLTVLLLMLGSVPVYAAQALVAAASDLRFVLPEIALAFEQDSGQKVRLVFGSSGNFAAQIRNGAPYELYLSADEAYVQGLQRQGLTRDGGTLYALGRIALVVPNGSTLSLDAGLQGLAAALDDGLVQRFAIANPAHAPYGQRAEEALRSAGLWQRLRPLLIVGENVSQAAQFALSGSSDGGIIALSLARAPQLAARARTVLIPAAAHTPLRQRMVLLNSAGAGAQAFYSYLQQPRARAVMHRYGFALPPAAP